MKKEQYFVLKFDSGAYYDGSRYANPRLVKASMYSSRESADHDAESVTKRWAKVTVVPVEIRETA